MERGRRGKEGGRGDRDTVAEGRIRQIDKGMYRRMKDTNRCRVLLHLLAPNAKCSVAVSIYLCTISEMDLVARVIAN